MFFLFFPFFTFRLAFIQGRATDLGFSLLLSQILSSFLVFSLSLSPFLLELYIFNILRVNKILYIVHGQGATRSDTYSYSYGLPGYENATRNRLSPLAVLFRVYNNGHRKLYRVKPCVPFKNRRDLYNFLSNVASKRYSLCIKQNS